MQWLQVNPPSITDATAQELYHRLSVCFADDQLPSCNSIAVIEAYKQLAFNRLESDPNEAVPEIMRLIALQQSSLAQIMGKERDSRP